MGKLEDIERVFVDHGIHISGLPLWDGESSKYIVFLPVEIDKSGKQHPSNSMISKVRKVVEEEYGDTSITQIRKGNEDVISSVKSVLNRRFPGEIRSVHVHLEKGEVSIWVELNDVCPSSKSDEMKGVVAELLQCFELSLLDFVNISERRLPSETACINVIRRMAPVTVEGMSHELGRRGFEVPGDNWLGKTLDKWRKNGLIHRKADGRFLMTVEGLQALGSTRDRRSPDVGRALDMAGRKE